MKRNYLQSLKLAGAVLGLAMACGLGVAQAAESYPLFKVDPAWPKQLPNNIIMGDLGGVGVDQHDHVWIINRQRTLDKTGYLGLTKTPPTAVCCRYAPAVIEFDADGNYIQGWGGPNSPTDAGAAFEWPMGEHGITIDYKDNVWICGYIKDAEHGLDDNQCLKFTKNGKFLMQIGHSGKSKGSLDTENLNHPTQVYVWPKTNEAFISDGYVNRRVIVFDADTGKFKRMWGAYGNVPDDSAPKTRVFEGPGPQQFNTVHGVRMSNDELLYISDRQNNRIQVFTPDGKFVKEAFVARDTRNSFGTVFSSAFSGDAAQAFLFIADLPNYKVHVLNRQTLVEIPEASFGHAGPYPGQFNQVHIITNDSKGNIYTSEANGARIQKWGFTGMSK